MSPQTKIIALGFALSMFVFSTYMYMQTGDWVAAVFALGSVGYALFFFSAGQSGK